MTFWVVVVLSILLAAFLFFQLIPRLLPKLVGYSYFRKQLWLNGINWRKVPAACLNEFVSEAFDYAKAASKPDVKAKGHSDSFLVEYERMMRVHAIVVAALLQGLTVGEVDAREKEEIESKIQSALMKGGRGIDTARAEVGKTLSIESLHIALQRADLGLFDMDGQERIAEDVRTGKTWNLQRSILRRHGLLPGI